MKASTPELKMAFVGPHVTARAEASLQASSAIDFVVRGEFGYPVAEFAEGRPLEGIAGVTHRRGGLIVRNPPRQPLQDLDALPFAVDVYKRDLDFTRYSIPYLLHPYVSFYTSRGCPTLCTFCLWPQTMSGHPWRTRSIPNVVAEVQRCSMLANSGFLNQDAHVAEKIADIDVILAAAERYFGREALHTRKLYTYECAKTEFLSDEEEKRRYSYWIEHPRDTNYIGVLPGKFSFFPTVAYQTYLRIKELLPLGNAIHRQAHRVDPVHEQQAKALVTEPYPGQILSAELDPGTNLLTGLRQELSVIPSAEGARSTHATTSGKPK